MAKPALMKLQVTTDTTSCIKSAALSLNCLRLVPKAVHIHSFTRHKAVDIPNSASQPPVLIFVIIMVAFKFLSVLSIGEFLALHVSALPRKV